MTAPSDIGNFLAETLLTTVQAQFTTNSLPMPATCMYIAGVSTSVDDCCEGLLWTRVDTVYPTDGSGNPYTQARPDWDIPAWVHPVQCGILNCHLVIDSEGNPIPPDLETQYAVRDGQYRAAILQAITVHYPPLVGPCALGYRISPWTPIGPEGGCSGGLITVNVITTALLTV